MRREAGAAVVAKLEAQPPEVVLCVRQGQEGGVIVRLARWHGADRGQVWRGTRGRVGGTRVDGGVAAVALEASGTHTAEAVHAVEHRPPFAHGALAHSSLPTSQPAPE